MASKRPDATIFRVDEFVSSTQTNNPTGTDGTVAAPGVGLTKEEKAALKQQKMLERQQQKALKQQQRELAREAKLAERQQKLL